MWLNSLHLDAKWHRHRRVRVSQRCLHSVPLEGQGLSSDGHVHGRHPIPPETVTVDACLSGWGVAGQDCSGSVVCPGRCTPYQRARASGCAACTHALFIPTGCQVFACSLGQHVRCGTNQPPGGHQVRTAAPGFTEPLVLGVPLPGQSAGSLSTRRPESGRRFPLSAQAFTGLVEASSRGGGDNLEPFRQGPDGPLCLGRVEALPPLVLLGRGDQPDGSGRSGARLARQSPVCLPATASDTTDASEGGHRLLLVTPRWPGRVWFPLLRSLCCSPPWRLPDRKDRLSQLRGQIWHPDPRRLQLRGPTRC
ncbi:uncharacterized protein LOC117550632 [Gymnodraco acuticeps]|uniref:Uncharacterized protein LOC117550632 n=1 Tax=Gymnodraco acuticeps TaxID=8218 RepID=A0A6P8UQS1_GYMAC|nr:uncharacterized protein LOC117550632 [Gymnodraco acuticeps]